MSFLKTQAIVLKESPSGESDKIITLFSQKRGKITAAARGARRPKNQFSVGTQYLCYSDFVLYEGKELYSVNNCEIIEPFFELRGDLSKLTYSAHLVDLVQTVIQENQPFPQLLKLFLNTLYLLSKTDKSPELLARIFELRMMALAGFSPWTVSCVNCGTEEFKSFFFSFREGGFLCEKCHLNDPACRSISEGAAMAIRYIVTSPGNRLFSFSVSDEILDELKYVNRRFLKENLDRDFNRLDFIDKLKNF